LGFVVSPSLDGNIVGSNTLSNSVEWKFGNEIEWSVHMETPIFVQSLSLWSSGFVEIFNIPSLSESSIVTPNTNSSAFFVLLSFNVKNFAALPVNELVLFKLEDLEPS
jgi:hypothetical protein